MDISTVAVIFRSAAIWKAAGATIEDARADINVKSDIVIAIIHFLLSGKLSKE